VEHLCGEVYLRVGEQQPERPDHRCRCVFVKPPERPEDSFYAVDRSTKDDA
jgi:hypothetical protein